MFPLCKNENNGRISQQWTIENGSSILMESSFVSYLSDMALEPVLPSALRLFRESGFGVATHGGKIQNTLEDPSCKIPTKKCRKYLPFLPFVQGCGNGTIDVEGNLHSSHPIPPRPPDHQDRQERGGLIAAS